jgi:hypothetical protein
MNTHQSTDAIIGDLIVTACGMHASAREKYLFAEALHALVRLAKAEQMLQIKKNVERLTFQPCASAWH